MVEVTQRTRPQPSQQFRTKREKSLARIRTNSSAGRTARFEAVGERLGIGMGEILKHPTAGFFPQDGRAAEWPLDEFTKHRLKEGVIRYAADQRNERR